jgi:spermidine/putrescine transport system substrate-binding protein
MLKRMLLSLLLTATIVSCGGEQKRLYVFTWANYVGDEIRDGFESEFGVRVVVDVFASNEDLLAKLKSGATGYDVIMPSDYMVAIMIKENLLAALDLSKIPNFKSIGTRFLGGDFDPENRYSIPYTWGTAGIGYDSTVVHPPPDSLSILWDKRYSGKFSMLDDQRETIGVALKLLGHSVNSTDLNALKAAKAKLIEQKPLVKQYKNEADEILGSGDVVMAHCWSGDAFRAAARRPNIKYVIPKEGATQFIDTVCIPTSAPHKALAAQFINYLLRPEINAKVTEFTKYGTCVPAARNYLPETVRNHPGIYPSEDVLNKLESIRDLGEFTRNYDRAWTELKAK